MSVSVSYKLVSYILYTVYYVRPKRNIIYLIHKIKRQEEHKSMAKGGGIGLSLSLKTIGLAASTGSQRSEFYLNISQSDLT